MKSLKCFYHLISFRWKKDGTWKYEDNEKDEELQLEIPRPDGSSVLIEHCGVNVAHKTLGVMTCPSGDSAAAVTMMKEKAQDWIDRATSAKLARRSIWFLKERQFKPRVGFGIGVNTAPLSVLSECLMKQYHKLVPLGGI